jgi:cysteine desulfuration protein SufE
MSTLVPQLPGDHDMTLDTIRSDFALLDDWEDRYRYVIELGRQLPVLPDTLRTDENKVRGCASQVWLVTHVDKHGAPRLTFEGDSDAHIVKGLVAILFAIYADKTAAEIAELDAEGVLRELGLSDHLTPQRSNGFRSMVDRIRSDARRALAEAAGGA